MLCIWDSKQELEIIGNTVGLWASASESHEVEKYN